MLATLMVLHDVSMTDARRYGEPHTAANGERGPVRAGTSPHRHIRGVGLLARVHNPRETMTVRCLGEYRLLEQVGEKQDFECMLTAHGARHEEFVLRVRRITHSGRGPEWNCDYSVTVARPSAHRRHVYLGGPAHGWLQRFASDLARGAYERSPTEPIAAPIVSRPPPTVAYRPNQSGCARLPSDAPSRSASRPGSSVNNSSARPTPRKA